MTKPKPQMPWTTKQDRVLLEFSHLGVTECQRRLKELGYTRSIGSIQSRAQRLGVSLSRQMICPLCDHMGPAEDFTKAGICRVCNTYRLIERNRREGERNAFAADVERAGREYARVRQANSRANRSGNPGNVGKKVPTKVHKRRSESKNGSTFTQDTLF